MSRWTVIALCAAAAVVTPLLTVAHVFADPPSPVGAVAGAVHSAVPQPVSGATQSATTAVQHTVAATTSATTPVQQTASAATSATTAVQQTASGATSAATTTDQHPASAPASTSAHAQSAAGPVGAAAPVVAHVEQAVQPVVAHVEQTAHPVVAGELLQPITPVVAAAQPGTTALIAGAAQQTQATVATVQNTVGLVHNTLTGPVVPGVPVLPPLLTQPPVTTGGSVLPPLLTQPPVAPPSVIAPPVAVVPASPLPQPAPLPIAPPAVAPQPISPAATPPSALSIAPSALSVAVPSGLQQPIFDNAGQGAGAAAQADSATGGPVRSAARETTADPAADATPDMATAQPAATLAGAPAVLASWPSYGEIGSAESAAVSSLPEPVDSVSPARVALSLPAQAVGAAATPSLRTPPMTALSAQPERQLRAALPASTVGAGADAGTDPPSSAAQTTAPFAASTTTGSWSSSGAGPLAAQTGALALLGAALLLLRMRARRDRGPFSLSFAPIHPPD